MTKKEKLIKNSNKYLIFSVFVFIVFVFSFSSASATTIPVNNYDCAGTITIDLNKSSYLPGEDIKVTDNFNITCTSPASFGGGYTEASTTPMFIGIFHYPHLPQTFKAPNTVGPFTIYTKWFYTYYPLIQFLNQKSSSGETQIVATVGVPENMTLDVTASPTEVYSGYTSTISWTSVGTSSCTSNNSSKVTSADGSIVSDPIIKDTDFEITCSGPDPSNPGGTRTITKKVTISTIKSGMPNGPITDVETDRAEPIRDTYAKLWGKMNPSGKGGDPLYATAYFRYSPVSPEGITPIFCNDIYGSNMKASEDFKLWSNKTEKVNIVISDLAPSTQYFYCLVGSNDIQIAYGKVKS